MIQFFVNFKGKPRFARERERVRERERCFFKTTSLHSKQIYIVMNFLILRGGDLSRILNAGDRMKLIMRRCFRHRSTGTRNLRCKFAVHSIRESPNKPNTHFHFLGFRLRLVGNEEILQLRGVGGITLVNTRHGQIEKKQVARRGWKKEKKGKKRFTIRLHQLPWRNAKNKFRPESELSRASFHFIFSRTCRGIFHFY